MMIVDLVDEIDFKEMLMEIGVPVTQDMALAEVQSNTAEWCEESADNVLKLRDVLNNLADGNITILPDVQNVIDSFK